MNYANILFEDKTHGEGLRCTLLVQGAKKDSKNIETEYKNPDKGLLFTDNTKKDIIEYIQSRSDIQGLSIAGGDPLYDTNVNTIYDLIQSFRNIFKDNKDIWLYTEYRWGEFTYWEHIIKCGFVLGDKYKTRLEIIKLVDIVHCQDVYSESNYSAVKVKESLEKKDTILTVKN